METQKLRGEPTHGRTKKPAHKHTVAKHVCALIKLNRVKQLVEDDACVKHGNESDPNSVVEIKVRAKSETQSLVLI